MVARLGEHLKELRQQRSLTLQQLAKAAGVSKSMISKIERGDADPTTNVLSRISEGLEVSVSQLVGGDHGRPIALIRQQDQPIFRDSRSGFERRSLSPLLPSRGIDFVMNTLPPGKSAGPFEPHQRGVDEYLVVTQGKLELRLGTDIYVLDRGDSIVFNGDVEHHFQNLTRSPCIYYIVIDSYRWR